VPLLELVDDHHPDVDAMRSHGSRSRGQALTEFALVIPLLAIILFGIIDLGRYVYAANALGNGAREGARAGSVSVRPKPDCDGLSREDCVKAVAKNHSWGLPANSITTPVVTCWRVAPGDTTPNNVPDVSKCRTNDLLKVHTESTFTLVTPIIAQFLGPLKITGESQVTVNQ
jgi:Flp pilus assembly protein TadG